MAVATGTGAVPLGQQDDVNNTNVVLEAGQNQLVDASAVQSGELSVNLRAANVTANGLSPGSQIDNVFNIRNKGNQSVDVFIEDSPAQIEFISETGGAFNSNETAVTLDSNESVSVGLKLRENATPGLIDSTFTVTVVAPETEPSGSDTGSDSQTTSNLPISGEDDSSVGSSVQVDLDPESADAAARVSDLDGNENATVDLQETVAASQVSYDQLFIGVEDDAGAVELRVDAIPEPPETEAAELTANNTAISYLQIESSASDLQLSDESISEARIDFAVSESVFEDHQISRDDPQLYRFNETVDEWVPLRTERIDTHSYRAFSPNFSVFAVGYPAEPKLQIVETTLVTSEVEADQPVAVAVRVTNTGSSPGEFQATLDAEQPSTVSDTVRVAPNSTETVILEQSVPILGTYDVEVNGNPVGPVTISEAPTESPPPTPPQEATPTDADETQTATQTPTPTDDTPGFGFVLTLVALASAGLLARRRARNR